MRSERFWLVALCHAIFVVVFKVFENFSSAILKTIYGYDVEKAGFVASLVPLASVLLAPAVGLASDRAPSAAAPILLAAVAAVAGFTSLAFGATTVRSTMAYLPLRPGTASVRLAQPTPVFDLKVDKKTFNAASLDDADLSAF